MRYAGLEENIGFHLIKVKGAAAKTGVEAYRAVMEHDGLSPEETLAELAKETGIPASQLQYVGSSLLNALYSCTMRDGRSRNFENFLSTRFDITGKFDRIDAPFEELKHKCALGIVPGAKVSDYVRRKLPLNETKPPRGRFDYITYPGGEKGFIKIGEEINIYGHDLLLDKHTAFIGITTYDKNGKGCYYSTIVVDRARLDKCDSRLLFNSDTLLKAAWPEAWTQELLHDQQTAKFRFMDCSGKGSHDSFSHPVTILR